MSAPQSPSVEVRTLLLTDLADSTKLAAELGDQRASAVFQQHAREARALLGAHAGLEIDKTDGFLFVFERATEALRYALAYHDLLERLSVEVGAALRARAGMHTGEVELVRATEAEIARGAKAVDVEGIAKPFAARLMSLAGAGQTLLSDRSAAALRRARDDGERLDPRLELLDHGTYRLKGIPEPADVWEAGIRGVSPLTPPDDGPKAYRVVRLADGGFRTVAELPNNLPRDVSSFFGRRGELAAIERAYDDGALLVTIAGTGGCGKTRLAHRYASGFLGDYPGGAWYGELSDARTADDLVGVVSRALGVELGSGDPVDRVGRAIAGRGRALVILDNFEQMDPKATAVLARWLRNAGDARFLVTSRELLQLEGERAVPLTPLAPPTRDSVASLQQNDAVALFVDRAKATLPAFALSDANAKAVGELVRMLDGLPLALELAAARVRVLPPAKIVERLAKRFELLSGGRRDADPRQRTLRAAIDWSWDLLEPWEKAALAQCSLFRGGFDLEAAEAVVDLAPWPDAPPVIDVVQALIDKSLLRSWVPEASGVRFDADTPWFGLLFSVQAYAAEKLEDPAAVTRPDGAPATGEAARSRAEIRHAEHYATYGAPEFVESLSMEDGLERAARLLLESQNLEIALERALQRGDAAHAAKLAHANAAAARGRAPLDPVIARLGRVLALEGLLPLDRATLLVDYGAAVGSVTWGSGEAREALDHAADLARELGDVRLEGRARINRAYVSVVGEAFEAGIEIVGRGLALAEQAGDAGSMIRAYGVRAVLANSLGRFEAAQVSARLGLEIAQRLGVGSPQAHLYGALGVAHYLAGDLDAARAALEQACEAGRAYRNGYNLGHHLALLADVHAQAGRAAEARVCALEALGHLRPQGVLRSCGVAGYALAMAALQDGELTEAKAEAEAAVQAMRDVRDRHELCIALSCRARVEAALGDRDAARRTLQEAETILESLEARERSPSARRVAAARAAVEVPVA